MQTSGLYDNFTQERNSVCMGQTIFGLTSTTGTSTIYDINFVSDADDYVNITTGISAIDRTNVPRRQAYDLGGRPAAGSKGIRITNGKKNLF